MGLNALTGTQKAAILLLSFGEETSAEIFRHLNEFEIKRIGAAMSRLGRLEEDVADEVIVEFSNIISKNQQFYYGGTEFTKKVIGGAFKGGEAEEIFDQLALSAANLDSLELIDAKTLAGFLRNEHPQTIALILAHCDAMKFGDILRYLPETLHTEVILRVANLDSVSPDLIDEIEDVLRQEIQAVGSIHQQKIGGVESIAQMLNVTDKASEEELLEALEERDADLAEEVRQLMFTFDDLVKIDDRGIQEIIKGVPNDKWMLALKTASQEVKDLVFNNMSTRAAEMLQDDMEAMGAVKLSDVEAAQYEILSITKKLEEEGKVLIASGDADFI